MSNEIFEGLKRAVLEYDAAGATAWAQKTVEERLDPLDALDVLTEAIRIVGDGFGRGDLWLPDLVGASEAMLAAMPIIEAEIARRGAERKSLGNVVIGTVYGDLHNIGKAMVSTLLTAEGFRVHDLGINVTGERFLQAIKEHDADILAMSALMTTTISEQRHVVER
ncbi:MAG TPA: cobalamin-dependent protein, partial [Anaerolineae bacterium]|nr:cobalamin-dependent protein [Anaerolineae bacterium]